MDTLKDAKVSHDVVIDPPGILGYWPMINLQPIEDYGKQSSPVHSDRERDGAAATGFPHRYLRIHMDVPLGTQDIFDKVKAALRSKSRQEAHRIIVEWPDLPPGTPRSYALLEAALRNGE